MTPRTYRSLFAVTLLALALAAGGCGKSTSPTNPNTTLDQTSADDIAVQTGVALGQLGLDVAGATGVAGSPAPTRLRFTPARAMWDTTIVVGGLTATVSLEYFDAQDRLLPGYDTTAVRLVWTSHIYGSLTT